MKPLSWLLLLLFSGGAFAQQIELEGIITIQNSGYNNQGQATYVQGAIVRAEKTAGATSRSDGRFRLVFVERPLGSVVEINVTKQGLEVVNEEELRAAAVVGRTTPLKVVMCPAGSLYESRIAYYNIAEQAILDKYERRIRILSEAGEAKDQLIAQLERNLNRQIESLEEVKRILEAERNTSLQMARQFAGELAQINLDDASERYIQAHEAYLANDLEQILQILQWKELEKDIQDLQEERRRIQSVDSLQAERKQTYQEKQRDLVNSSLLLAFVEYNAGRYNEAEQAHRLAIEADPANFQSYQSYVDFLGGVQRFSEALAVSRRAVEVAASTRDKATAYQRLGTIYAQLDYEQEGLAALLEAEKNFAMLYDTSSMEEELAYLYRDLAYGYGGNKQVDKKVDFLIRAVGVWEYFLDEDRASCMACNQQELLKAYTELCATYYQIGKEEAGEVYCDKSHKMMAVAIAAISDEPLDYTGEEIDQKVADLLKQIYLEEDFSFDQDSAIALIFELFDTKEKQITKDRAIHLPAIAYNYSGLARTTHRPGGLEIAELAYAKAYALFKELNTLNPEQYNSDILFCLHGLKNIYIGQRDTSAIIDVLEELRTAYDNYFAKDPLQAITSYTSDIGYLLYLYHKQKAFQKAYTLSLEALAKQEALRDKYPDKPMFREAVPRAYGGLAWACLFAGRYADAERYSRLAIDQAPREKWLHTNLGHSYLFRGQREKADSVYRYLLDLSADPAFLANPGVVPFHTVLYRDFSDFREAGILPEALTDYVDEQRIRFLCQQLAPAVELRSFSPTEKELQITKSGHFLFLGTGSRIFNGQQLFSELALHLEKDNSTIRLSGTFDNRELSGRFTAPAGTITKSTAFEWDLQFSGQFTLGQNDGYQSPVIHPDFDLTLHVEGNTLFGQLTLHPHPPHIPEPVQVVIDTEYFAGW